MCGIVGYVGSKDCADVLIDSLSKLEYRGYDSAGIAVFEKGEISVCKAKGELKNLTEKMKKEHNHMDIVVLDIQDGQHMVNHQTLTLIHMEIREYQLYTMGL